MIEKPMWQKGLLAMLLVVAIGLFYAVSNVEEVSGPPGSNLVVLEEEALPVSGGLFVARLQGSEEQADVSNGSTEVAMEAASGDAAALVQALGERSRSLDAFRLARTVARSRRTEALERSLTLSDLSGERREAILAELLSLVESEEAEKQAEGLLVARGLTDALVYLANQRAEVIVVETIDREEAGRIGDLVARVAGVPLDHITIVDGAGD